MDDQIIRLHDDDAENYDAHADHYLWGGHEILFGMAYALGDAPARLLDVGIGTGLGSYLFQRAGWEVWGFDGGSKLLEQCAKKGFATDLRTWDLREFPWPYKEHFFHGAVCCGVLHFFTDLTSIFAEVARVTAPGGFFAFTTKVRKIENKPIASWQTVMMEGAEITEHDHEYIQKCLDQNGFSEVKWQPFHAGALDAPPELFVAYVGRKAIR